ncbi:hypothetical protein SDJN03_14253, partial [Cucurbita argyrosperma subsp. sororia]
MWKPLTLGIGIVTRNTKFAPSPAKLLPGRNSAGCSHRSHCEFVPFFSIAMSCLRFLSDFYRPDFSQNRSFGSLDVIDAFGDNSFFLYQSDRISGMWPSHTVIFGYGRWRQRNFIMFSN